MHNNEQQISDILKDIKALITRELPAIQQRRYDIQYKSDNSPVTAADIYLENKIRSYLQQTLSDLTFIGEESFDFTLYERTGYWAVLDPIDGTENFCSGLKEWGVSLGIWHGKQHLGSLLMMPELEESIMTGDSISKRHSRITGFSSSYNEEITQGISNAEEYRVMGCAVYNLINVIKGSYKQFINPKGAYIWDLLPGVMLALEHNCEVYLNDKAYSGQAIDPTKKHRVDIRN